jgi:SAM-dependent methyltransferase
MTDLPDAEVNRAYWDGYSDEYQQLHGEQLRTPLAWGMGAVPETQVHALGDARGLDVLEYGCGAAQWSIFLTRRGARVTGLDISARQLAHARALMSELATPVPVVQAPAESVPFRDASFDLVFCDHGAMSYADPRRTLPEVARLLRPGGRLVFNMITPFTSVCWNDAIERPDAGLHHDYFGLGKWTDTGGFVSYELGYGAWIRLFRTHGFVVDDLIELRPPARATDSYRSPDEQAWARRWPHEHIWCTTHP